MLIFIAMIRTFLFGAILMLSVTAKAQTAASFGSMNGAPSTFKRYEQAGDTNHIQKKWFVTKYVGISTGFVSFGGGGGSFLTVPLTLQANRELNKNLYAFGSVSVAPYLFNYNSAVYQSSVNKNSNFMQPNVNAYSEAKVGLMYINDEKTFSISGSIGVSRGGYNSYTPF